MLFAEFPLRSLSCKGLWKLQLLKVLISWWAVKNYPMQHPTPQTQDNTKLRARTQLGEMCTWSHLFLFPFSILGSIFVLQSLTFMPLALVLLWPLLLSLILHSVFCVFYCEEHRFCIWVYGWDALVYVHKFNLGIWKGAWVLNFWNCFQWGFRNLINILCCD